MGSVRKRPDGRWRARYRGPDKRERSRHFDRKQDAERWLAGIEVSKARGEWIDPSLSKVTVGAWCEVWMDAQVQLKPTTRKRYAAIIVNKIGPTWAKVALADVTSSDVSGWISLLADSGLGTPSIRYAHRVLSLALKAAVLDGRLPRNPAEGVPLPRAKSRTKVHLSHDELARLADECGTHRTLVLFLGYTGVRWGEVSALRIQDLDLAKRRAHVRLAMAEVSGAAVVGTPKDHEQRWVPLPDFLVGLLVDQTAGRAPDELVFPASNGGHMRNGNFRTRVFDAAAQRAGVPKVTPHGLRHTAASLAIQSGASVVLVCRMLGHSSPVVTLGVYAHLFSDDLDSLGTRLNDAKIKAAADQVRTNAKVIKLETPAQEAEDAS